MVLAAAERDDADLVGATVADDFRGHAGALERVADLDAVAVAEHEHVVERDLVAGLVLAEQLDAERLALHPAVLLTAGDPNCVPDCVSCFRRSSRRSSLAAPHRGWSSTEHLFGQTC